MDLSWSCWGVFTSVSVVRKKLTKGKLVIRTIDSRLWGYLLYNLSILTSSRTALDVRLVTCLRIEEDIRVMLFYIYYKKLKDIDLKFFYSYKLQFSLTISVLFWKSIVGLLTPYLFWFKLNIYLLLLLLYLSKSE